MPQQTIHKLIERSALLGHVIAVEPNVLSVLERAAQQGAYRTRWAAYSALKEQCRCLVGWQARDVQLREPHYHETVMAALDVLLPTSEEWEGVHAFAYGRHASEEQEEEEV
jgi:hypothetical protein